MMGELTDSLVSMSRVGSDGDDVFSGGGDGEGHTILEESFTIHLGEKILHSDSVV